MSGPCTPVALTDYRHSALVVADVGDAGRAVVVAALDMVADTEVAPVVGDNRTDRRAPAAVVRRIVLAVHRTRMEIVAPAAVVVAATLGIADGMGVRRYLRASGASLHRPALVESARCSQVVV